MEKLSTYGFPPDGLECYYFTGSVENALDILVFNHLFGSMPSKVNDPEDLKITVANLSSSPLLQWLSSCNRSNIEMNVNAALADKTMMDRTCRFVCFAKAQEVDKDRDSELYFWRRYADNFKGVRFKFRIDKDFLYKPSSYETFCGDIDYNGRTATVDGSVVGNQFGIRAQVAKEQLLKDLCYSKSAKWKNEHEFRLGSVYTRLHLMMSRITSKEERYFIFNPQKLMEVAVGCNAPMVDAEILTKIARSRGVILRRAKVNLQYETICGESK